MYKTKLKKWLKFIPQILYTLKNQKNTLLIKKTYISQNILNWNFLCFFIFYQLKIIKNVILYNNKILIVSEFVNFKIHLKLISKITKCFFLIGPWKNGFLSNLYWYKYLPSFILNFGMFYLKTYLNETAVLNIPNLIFFNQKKNNMFLNKLNYFILTVKTNYIYFYFLFFVLFYILKKYKNNCIDELFQIKKEFFSSIFYLKTLRKIKKKELIFLDFKLIYQKLFKNNFFLNTLWIQKLKKYKKIKNIKNILLTFFTSKETLMYKLYLNFIFLKKIKKNEKKKKQKKVLFLKKIILTMPKKNKNLSFQIMHNKNTKKKNKTNIDLNLQKWINLQFLK